MSSFWLEDDTGPASGSNLLSSLSQNELDASDQACLSCGRKEGFYTDAAAGQQVCNHCFTQQDTVLTQTDFEDTMAVSAKTRGGNLKSMSIRKGRKRKDASERLKPQPEWDRSVPLPTVEMCLDGMRMVLQQACRQLAKLIGSDVTDVVLDLWVRYLQSWQDCAEHYGKIYPTWRFSFRDMFLSTTHQAMVRNQVASAALEKARAKRKEDAQPSNKQSGADVHDFNESNEVRNTVKKRRKNGGKKGKAKQVPRITGTAEKINMILRAHVASKKPLGPKQAALRLRPSMDLVAGLLYLATIKTVTSSEISLWIASDAISLQNGFVLLSIDLQNKLRHIQPFFRLHALPRPSALESTAVVLAVACRIPRDESPMILQPWSHNHLARYCTLTGVSDEARARSETLFKQKELVGKVTGAEHMLAIIAIACQQDSSWREWTYHRPIIPIFPANDSVLHRIGNDDDSAERYIDFCENNIFHQYNSDLWNDFGELELLVEKRASSDVVVDPQHTESRAGRTKARTTYMGGIPMSKTTPQWDQYQNYRENDSKYASVTDDDRLLMLLDYLASCTRTDKRKIHSKLVAILGYDKKIVVK